MLTAAVFDGAVLTITGSEGPDRIWVRQYPGSEHIGIDNVMIYDAPTGRPVTSVWSGQISRIDVNGLGGNDEIRLAGHYGFTDCNVRVRAALYGGGGDDWLIGGDQNDEIFGHDGNDAIEGRGGVNFLAGWAGNDTIQGGDSDDSIWGGGDNDTLYGNGGNDWIVGHEGGDVLYGGIGNDTLEGGPGPNRVFGEGGNDTLVSGDDDELRGGTENDRFVFPVGSAAIAIDGGPGVDAMDLSAREGGAFVSLKDGYGTMLATQRREFRGIVGIENLVGTVYADQLVGDDRPNLIEGRAGNDNLSGQGDNDNLIGGPGIDSLQGDGGNDALFGGSGDGADTLTGGAGSDRLLMTATPIANRDLSTNPASINYIREDTAVGFGLEDASPLFLNGYAMTVTVSPSETLTYSGRNWTDNDVLRVDAVLDILHREGRGTRLVKRSTGDDLVFVRHGTTFRGFNQHGRIHLTDQPLQFGGTDTDLRGYVLHEIGHHWQGTAFQSGGTSYWNQFVGLSGWRDTDPRSTQYTLSTNEGRGNRWYLRNAAFASAYARTNADEDFAESFAAYFTQRAGWAFYANGAGAAAIPGKLALFTSWVRNL